MIAIAREGDLPNVLVPLGMSERVQRLAFAEENGLGVELTAFISCEPLNIPSARRILEASLSRALKEFSAKRLKNSNFAPRRHEFVMTFSWHFCYESVMTRFTKTTFPSKIHVLKT